MTARRTRRDGAERDGFFNATCTIPEPGTGEPDWSSLATGRGVVVFENAAGTTSLVATSANIRAMARKRLDPEGGTGKGAVNLRAVTSMIRTATTGSSFESDLIYLELARTRLAHVYGSVTDRWKGWFVEVDPGEEFPRFAKTPTGAMGAAGPGRRLLGPLGDKHAGAHLVELLEDLFDLCRYHHILIQAPEGTACVYKEMGKCPAPCDGSEGLEDYRARLREAIAFATDPASGIEDAEARMREASAALDFERAERMRKWVERAGEMKRAKFRQIRDLQRFRLIAVTPSERRGFARLIAVGAGRWASVCDVRRDEVGSEIGICARRWIDGLGAPGFSRAEMDRLGLVCAWLAKPEKNRRTVRFIWDDGRSFEDKLLEAIRRDPGVSEDDEPAHEIGADHDKGASEQ